MKRISGRRNLVKRSQAAGQRNLNVSELRIQSLEITLVLAEKLSF